MKLTQEIFDHIEKEVKNAFLKYVQIDTQSDESTGTHPSTEKQFDLANILKEELTTLGLLNVVVDEYCYVYADLPASEGYENVQRIGFLAHMDTSPAASGNDVKPLIRTYEEKTLSYPDDPSLTLSERDSPELKHYVGEEIITASGKTLLGADDKAGIAEIMTALSILKEYPEIKHGPITICFTPDEEIGEGVTMINKDRLPAFCYTLDGGEAGEIEFECFDAWKAEIIFNGLSVHPGYAKNKMINALRIATLYVSSLPEAETPEHTEKREGFYHFYKINGSEEKATIILILRDFEEENNHHRMNFLESLARTFEKRHRGLKIDLNFEHSYENMQVYLKDHPYIIEKAVEAIKEAELEPIQRPIRGGTDGARLSAQGIPTPNIFAGGLLFHSRKEYIPIKSLIKATEVIIYLLQQWIKK